LTNTQQLADTEILDAHHHLWRYTPQEYDWIDESMQPLRRDFLPADLESIAPAAGVTGTVVVQARQTLEETDWLLSLAQASNFIHAVVGWAPIASPQFPEWLDANSDSKKLAGLRHIVQAEPDPDFLLQPAFDRGIRSLLPTGLVYDILVFERQLEQAIRFADLHPNQIFVLDHIAKPRIAENQMEPWAKNIRALAQRPNVYCKLSGMVTEANWSSWTEATLMPYFDVVLEAFTPRRLMLGSDWPVCLVATQYADWFALLRRVIARFSVAEQQSILSGTAREAYSIA